AVEDAEQARVATRDGHAMKHLQVIGVQRALRLARPSGTARLDLRNRASTVNRGEAVRVTDHPGVLGMRETLGGRRHDLVATLTSDLRDGRLKQRAEPHSFRLVALNPVDLLPP